MKTVLPILFASLAVAACAATTSAPVAASATAAPAAAPAVAQAGAPAPSPARPPTATAAADLAAGKRDFEQGCFSCHDQAIILAQGGRTRADWEDVVHMMQDRGYSGSPEEVKRVVDYLAATHPPKS